MTDETHITRTIESDGVHLVGAGSIDYTVTINVVGPEGEPVKELSDEIAQAVHEVVDE